MYISKIHTLDTGGNVFIKELLIEEGGQLKSICISSDCIVGYQNSFIDAEFGDDLFLVTTKRDLEKHVPPSIAQIAWGFYEGGKEDE